MDYCYSTDTDGDLLIENTMVGHGWVEGGHLFGSHTSLYLASCWQEALEYASYMAKAIEDDELAVKYKNDAMSVKEIINNNFWNEDAEWFCQGLKKDGNYHTSEAIMPAIPMYFEQIDSDKSQAFLSRIASNEFSSDWGTRITGMNDPHYNAGGYHTGSVWPLYTGWASLVEYKYGNSVQGFTHIMNNLMNYKQYSLGFVDEVLHGEDYKPFGVCPHQCWSETMVLQPIIEGMLGFEPDAVCSSFKLKPNLPADWDSLSVKNLKVSNGNINFGFKRADSKYTYTFSENVNQKYQVSFSPVLPPGTTIEYVKLNGILAYSNIAYSDNGVSVSIDFELSGDAVIEIGYQGGISVLPMQYDIEAGMKSSGFRIIDAVWDEGKYKIDLEGRNGYEQVLRIYYGYNKLPEISGGKIVQSIDNIMDIKVEFEKGDTAFSQKTIEMDF